MNWIAVILSVSPQQLAQQIPTYIKEYTLVITSVCLACLFVFFKWQITCVQYLQFVTRYFLCPLLLVDIKVISDVGRSVCQLPGSVDAEQGGNTRKDDLDKKTLCFSVPLPLSSLEMNE